jgi:hypothetical protein
MKPSLVETWTVFLTLVCVAAPLAAQQGGGQKCYVNTQAILKATLGRPADLSEGAEIYRVKSRSRPLDSAVSDSSSSRCY